MRDVPNPGRLKCDPLLLPGQEVLHVHSTRSHASCKPGLLRRPCKKCDLEGVWTRCSGKGHRGPPERPLSVRTQSPRPAGKVPKGTPRAGPRSPYSLPQRDPAQGSVLPGPRKVETHFRRVHDLPRLLLSLAAGDGTGHRDS